MTVLSWRRLGLAAAAGRGWVLLRTVLLVLAIGASSALVFTRSRGTSSSLFCWRCGRSGAFVSVFLPPAKRTWIRPARDRWSMTFMIARFRRREYERPWNLAAPRAGLERCAPGRRRQPCGPNSAALRTSLEILFTADLEHRPALGTVEKEARAARALDGESPPVTGYLSDHRVMAVRGGVMAPAAPTRP